MAAAPPQPAPAAPAPARRALALLAARPFLERPAGLARDIVLVIDTSASMAATDVVPDRLTRREGRRDRGAPRPAHRRQGQRPRGGPDRADRRQRDRATSGASAMRSRAHGQPERVATWAMPWSSPPSSPLGPATPRSSSPPMRRWPTDPTAPGRGPGEGPVVGRDRKNQAIVALAVRTDPSAVTRSVFVSVANLDLELTRRRVELCRRPVLEVRDVLLEPQARADVIIDDVHETWASGRAAGRSDPEVTTAPDQLAVDDRAWAVIPPDRTRLVPRRRRGRSCTRDRAPRTCPNVELYGVTPASTAGDRAHGRPAMGSSSSSRAHADHPAGISDLAIAPPRTSPLGDVTGNCARTPDRLDPTSRSRYVDLSTTHLVEAHKLRLPVGPFGHPGPRGALIYAGTGTASRPRVAFEPRRSGLAAPGRVPDPAGQPHRRAAGARRHRRGRRPGTPVELVMPAGGDILFVTLPTGP